MILKLLKLLFGLNFLLKSPGDERVVQFCDISEVAMFHTKIWTCNKNSMHQSTKACESFHYLLKNIFYSTHTNIYFCRYDNKYSK